MECNKDEAVRAKEIAEKKMHGNDFKGAQRFALKAQNLFPELENISQILAVCNVHCSAENKMLGSEKDWYSILQVERLADEATIKKQYRKLALVLHPDKNKFPGAEAAFKIIGEAHGVLSDSSRRSFYDSKVGISLKSAQARAGSHKVNTNPPAKKPFFGPNNAANGVPAANDPQSNQYQANYLKENFWTCCPVCKIRYQFYKDLENKILRCLKCSNPYLAINIGAQGVPGSSQRRTGPPGVPHPFNHSAPAVSKQNYVPNQGTYGFSGQKTGIPMASNVGFHENAGFASAGSAPVTEMRTNANANNTKDGEKDRNALPKDETLQNETDLKNKKRKRGKKLESESDEDSSVSSIMEDVDPQKFGSSGQTAGSSSESNASRFVRRSHRQKHQVSYIESDDDFESPPKRPCKENSFQTEGKPEGEDVVNSSEPMKQQEKVPSEPSAEETTKSGACQTGTQMPSALNGIAGEFGEEDVSESDVELSDNSFVVPEPEFHKFDKLLREESCFEAGQFWACYDEEGLPRYYAKIEKVYSNNPFRVKITWLEFNPDDDGENDWVERDLPVGCGKYKRGESQEETNLCVFSHQTHCEKVNRSRTLMVYPRKGEIWALFKDWNMGWSSDMYKKCRYEIVEVASNFEEGVGVRVAFLVKLNGFVSLFQQRSQNKDDLLLVQATEMLRFSHRIPSFAMTGLEKGGVPDGSFELDPAGLPTNCDDSCYRSVSDADVEKMTAEANCSVGESPNIGKAKLSEADNTPKKPMDSMRGIDVGGGSFRLRRSPRGLKIMGENNHPGHVNGEGDFSLCKNGVVSGLADKRTDKKMQGLTPGKSDSTHYSRSPDHKVSEDLLYDFREDRSEGKFEVNQIWALYTPEQKLRKIYGQIKKIEQFPLKLHVALLEPMSPPENGRECACGMFKVISGKLRVFEPSSFSHLLDAKADKKRVKIYPKVGEVWALYSDWNAELRSSELKNCACKPVEIIDVKKGFIQVSFLEPLAKYKLVFKAYRRQSVSELLVIPENELGRFSHQIPAVRLTAEKGGNLAGCLLVDAAAYPVSK